MGSALRFVNSLNYFRFFFFFAPFENNRNTTSVYTRIANDSKPVSSFRKDKKTAIIVLF